MSSNPTPPPTSPLNVTLAECQVTLGGAMQQVSLAAPIEDYIGDELFVHSTFDDAQTLAIRIDQDRPQNAGTHPHPHQHQHQLTAVDLTVAYNDSTSTQTFALETTYGGGQLAVSMKLSTDLSAGYLFVTEAAPPAEPTSDNDTFLGFILVQDVPAEDGDALYRVNWVGPIDVEDYPRFGSATIVLPPASGGSITGPMGLQMP